MKIIFVTPSLKTGGGNRVFIELANQLLFQNRNEVSIIAPNNSADQHTFNLCEGISVRTIGKMAKGKLLKIVNIIKTIRYLNNNHRNDVIILSDPLFSIFLFLIKNKRLYRFVQADDYRIFDDGAILGQRTILKVYKELCLKSYRYKNVKFIFNSKFVYEQYCKDSKRVDIPFNLVHPALNSTIFNEKRRVHSATDDKLSICLIARKHPLKGIINFINVWHDLDYKYRNMIKKVVMVSHDDLSSFDTSGINIVIPKSDEEIAKEYCNSDIFISTSWWEGFGLPPLEAMACGCAVICSKSGGANEYARDAINCLMFEPMNEQELKLCLVRMIEHNELRDSLAKEALKSARQFSWEKSANQLMQILDFNGC